MADDAARAGPDGEHRQDLLLPADLNRRLEAWIAGLPVRPAKNVAIRALLTKALDAEGVPA
jgi:hypothetical protein